MSTVVSVRAYKFRKCLQYLSPIFPKGTTEIPLGINLSKGKLTLTCTTGCVFQAVLDVDSQDTATATVIYYSTIGSFLPGEENIDIEFLPTGIQLSGDNFEVTLPMGYSTVLPYDFGKHYFKDIESLIYKDNMTTLLGMNLDKLYSKPRPIAIYQDVAVLKYPNTWVQIRTTGLSFVGSLDPEHVRMLCKFEPTRLSADEGNTLILQNDFATLRLPCRTDIEENNFVSLLKDMDKTLMLSFDGYLEKLRNASKIDSKSMCKLTIYEEGVKTTISVASTSMAVKAGKTDGDVLSVVHLPLQVWLAFIKALGNGVVQILVGGDKLCLRNQSLVILTRVVP